MFLFCSASSSPSGRNPHSSQTVASQEQAGSVLAIDKVTVQDETFPGEVRNKSKNTVRDVQLFIRFTWLWADERHLGKDNPSAAFYQTVAGEIAPGGALPFKFTQGDTWLDQQTGWSWFDFTPDGLAEYEISCVLDLL